jgi:hypothetical protein
MHSCSRLRLVQVEGSCGRKQDSFELDGLLFNSFLFTTPSTMMLLGLFVSCGINDLCLTQQRMTHCAMTNDIHLQTLVSRRRGTLQLPSNSLPICPGSGVCGYIPRLNSDRDGRPAGRRARKRFTVDLLPDLPFASVSVRVCRKPSENVNGPGKNDINLIWDKHFVDNSQSPHSFLPI